MIGLDGQMDHYARVGWLATNLAALPPDYKVFGNNLGNLGVLNEKGEYVGYIDFRWEELNLGEGEKES